MLNDYFNVTETLSNINQKPQVLHCQSLKILKFKTSYISLFISVTSKLHAVFYDVPQLIMLKKIGLDLFSEQAIEAFYSILKPLCER